ncbi:MAG: Excinuclease ABC subunit C [uncultured Sulfurovum sp.]|uniref:UvrABC system protein C n=1 Tax=uncultured Sulfurovum sp. TaxID=269237 RepID=A0A6S6UA49_9BACT|nr:MAG: Excinuclease ABC subunit C [uncultured Sulfurovum sp.]
MIKTIQNLPTDAGVYQYFDKNDKLLYVGKAKNLKNRVKSYWRFTPELHPNPKQGLRILRMLEQAVKIEYIVVDSEDDALILENSLIKQLNPKYNILLRDDKTYPYIYINESQDYPRFELTRKVIKGKNISYYGPFPNGGKILLETLYELFPLVQKKSCLREGKACLFYQIKKCLAPCEEKITPNEYQQIINSVKKAISKRSILIEKLNDKMIEFAMNERYEEAATMRDNIKTIEALTISSNIDLANNENLDIFAIINTEKRGVIVKLFMRAGRVISSSFSTFRASEMYDENEAYKQALLEFYHVDSPQISKHILVAHPFEDQEEIATLLSKRFERKIELLYPLRGVKAKLINLALKNAEEVLKKEIKVEEIEPKIAKLFELDKVPYRIESFDNSHMMGAATVGAMVVWSEGKWLKTDYRRYELEAKDEYGQMKEMLTRRIESFEKNSPPDLWILDGGETLRRLAVNLLKEAKVNLAVIAIAKEKLDAKAHRAKGAAKDIIYTETSVFELQTTDKRLQWVQRQRDEAHRFAITYHQNKKRKDDTQNSLLQKKGIGPATIKKLLNYFGTFKAIEEASFHEISVASSEKIAKILKTDSVSY